MKRSTKILIVLAVVAALATGTALGIYAAGSYGSQSDPLVTKSYVDAVREDVLSASRAYADETGQAITDSWEQTINDLRAELRASLAGGTVSADSVFVPVTVYEGQTLTCQAGAELLVRTDGGVVRGGLSDTTAGTAAADGQYVYINHMYAVPSDGAGIIAYADLTVLVRGSYSVN